MTGQGFREDQPIAVENDVWIGAGVVVLPGRRIGRGSTEGAGAVVARDVPPYSVAAGNTAVVVRSGTLERPVGERSGLLRAVAQPRLAAVPVHRR